jgi:4-amino-4-deoxy-L-arabinose transferase-like glycosyltransferase
VLPDGPLDAALLAMAYAFVRAVGVVETPAPRWWWGVGVFAGLAMLSKYNAMLVLGGAGLVLLTDSAARRELRRFGPWGAVLLAALMFAPVVYWNSIHHWQSFGYQGGRAEGARLRWTAPFSIWGGEALFVLPWIWVPMVVLMVRALWRGPAERRGWTLGLMAVIPVVLFAVVGVWSQTRILYHWAAPGYLMLFPMLGDWAARRRPVVVASFSAFLLAGAAILLVAALNFPTPSRLALAFAPGKSPLLQAVDWDSITAEIPPGTQAVAALRWYDAGKLGYALRGRLPVTVFGPEPHEFANSVPVSGLLGKNILLIAMPGDVSKLQTQYAPDFARLVPGPALVVAHEGQVLLVIPTFLGEDLLKAPP